MSTTPTALLVTRYTNLSSTTNPEGLGVNVFDNRNIYDRTNDTFSIYVQGTGSWTAALNYSDVSASGPWSSFGTGASITNASASPIASGLGYHTFIQVVITGSATATFTAWKQAYVPSLSGAVSFPVQIGQGGTGQTAVIPAKGASALNIPVLSATDYDFTPQTPNVALIGGGVNQSITLSPVPYGVNGVDTNHYLYISGGTGTAEAVLITGGTAVSGAASGTVTFTPTNSHSGAWTIASATGGIQEAHNMLPVGGGTIWLPAGETIIYAQITVTTMGTTIRGHGAGWQEQTNGGIATRVTVSNGANVGAAIYVLNSFAFTATGFEIYGNSANQTSGTGHGLWINNTGSANAGYNTIRDLSITLTRGDGFHATNSGVMDQNIISHVMIRDVGGSGALLSGWQDSVILQPQFGGCYNGSAISISDGGGIKIIGGECDFSSSYGIAFGGTSNCDISGTAVDSCSTYGIGIFGGSTRITVRGVKITNSGYNGSNPYGIYIGGTVADISLIGVHCFNNVGQSAQTYGLYLDSTLSGGPISILGCNFRVRSGPADTGNQTGAYFNHGTSFSNFVGTLNTSGIDDALPVIASAATLNLANSTDNVGTANTCLLNPIISITGTTTVTAIQGGWKGRRVTFVKTDAGSLTIMGYTLAQNKSLTLTNTDGTSANWF